MMGNENSVKFFELFLERARNGEIGSCYLIYSKPSEDINSTFIGCLKDYQDVQNAQDNMIVDDKYETFEMEFPLTPNPLGLFGDLLSENNGSCVGDGVSLVSISHPSPKKRKR